MRDHINLKITPLIILRKLYEVLDKASEKKSSGMISVPAPVSAARRPAAKPFRRIRQTALFGSESLFRQTSKFCLLHQPQPRPIDKNSMSPSTASLLVGGHTDMAGSIAVSVR